MKVLVTGGAGFIGSTVASACLDAGIDPVILDDLSTGRPEFVRDMSCYVGDVADGQLIDNIFSEHADIAAVVHCAARIVVPESVVAPLDYYINNLVKTIELVQHLLRHNCQRLIFSSSAAILRAGPDFKVSETSSMEAASPYGRTKMMTEMALADAAAAHPLRVISLRYFNPIGADPELRTGLQAPVPSTALGQLMRAYSSGEPFTIMGTDWPTRDGTALRDYIHVWDLARAHVAAVRQFDQIVGGDRRYDVINLGTGTGTTVRELVAAFGSVVGKSIDVVEAQRRPGDVVGSYTTVDKAKQLLQWSAQKTVQDGIRDSLRWARRRPEVLQD